MRRNDREIKDNEEITEILNHGKYAVISLCRDNEPYIVTLSYGYDASEKALYFHCGEFGLKMDFIHQNPKVCATVIDDKGYINGECGHGFRSVVMFGKIIVLDEIEQKKHGLKVLLEQLEENPNAMMDKALNNEDVFQKVAVLKLDINELSAKKGR